MVKTFLKEIETIQQMQTTIDKLLNLKLITNKEDSESTGRWNIKELYHEKGECNIGFAESPDIAVDFPIHRHPSAKEYIICIKGSALVNISGASRVLQEGDCASIPGDTLHYTKPLQPNTKLLYVCVPNDKHFQEPTTHER